MRPLFTAALFAVTLSGCGIDFDPFSKFKYPGHKQPNLACPAVAIVCEAGQEQADVDRDGCALECRDIEYDGGKACIEIAVECPAGQAPADTDGDGCALECAPSYCPTLAAVTCPSGYQAVDADGDGCALECRPVRTCGNDDGGSYEGDVGTENDGGAACIKIAVHCPAGQSPADTDGDGCALECRPDPTCGNDDGGSPDVDAGVACPAYWPVCADDEEVADVDGDGCALECRPIAIDAGVACPAVWVECSNGASPIDSNGDGCALECPTR